MKANELMLGDYVQNSNGNIGKVIGYTEYGEVIVRYSQNSTCFSDPDLLLPIHLTPEILEKNGFVKCIGGRSKKSLQLIGDGLYVSWWNDRIVIRYKRVLGHPSAYLNCDCRYVHELQHIMKICGIDKDIVL